MAGEKRRLLRSQRIFFCMRLVFGRRRQLLLSSLLPPILPPSPLSWPLSSPTNTKNERRKIRKMTNAEHCAIIVPFFSASTLSYIVSIAANLIAANSSATTFTPHVSLSAAAATTDASFFFHIFLMFSLLKYKQRKTKD